ncbi:hypothetical protein ABFP60_11900 [Clostridioides difficile]
MNNLKSLMWTIVGIVIFIAIVKFFIYLIPFILVIALVGYIVFKGKKFFRNKKDNNETYNTYSQSQYTYETSGIDDSNDGKVIDVDYKEVDK